MTETGASNELPVLLGGARSTPEMLMLIGAPEAGGVVHVRSWTSEDWSATPVTRAERASALLEWIEREVARGRTINQSLYSVRLWLARDERASR
jgi:hypothetical protein